MSVSLEGLYTMGPKTGRLRQKELMGNLCIRQQVTINSLVIWAGHLPLGNLPLAVWPAFQVLCPPLGLTKTASWAREELGIAQKQNQELQELLKGRGMLVTLPCHPTCYPVIHGLICSQEQPLCGKEEAKIVVSECPAINRFRARKKPSLGCLCEHTCLQGLAGPTRTARGRA